MTNKDDKQIDKRYLKKFEIVETDTELPIQGQVRDPEDLYKFLKDFDTVINAAWYSVSRYLKEQKLIENDIVRGQE